MTSLLTIRAAASGTPSYAVDAVPHAYEEAGRVQFKAMPGVRWIADRGSPNGRGFYRGPVEAIRIVTATLEAAGVCKVQWEASEITAPATGGALGFPAKLRDYQADGVSWLRWQLARTRGALLADDMGIGKTAQAIVALDAPGRLSANTLVICPAVVVRKWGSEIAKWQRAEGKHTWRVISYEGFRKAWKAAPEQFAEVEALVLDEIHYCSNPKAKRTVAIAEFITTHPAVLRIGLSGTPMLVRPIDLWQPLDLLWPGRFGTRWAFGKRYCNGQYVEIPKTDKHAWDDSGVSRPDELAIRLQACMLRRTKSQVALELPERTRVVHEVELPPKALKDLQHATAAIDWRGSSAHGASVSTLLGNVEAYKVAAAIELVGDIVIAGGRVLVLTTRVSTAKDLGLALGAPVVYGETPSNEREEILRDATIGVATMTSVTTGIDLVGYDHIVFTGLDWIPSVLLQAESRIHRIGQHRPVTIYYLVGVGTLDEVVRERVIERLETFDTITGAQGDEGDLAKDLSGGSDDDLLAAMVAAVTRKAA
jgi:SWI/SNF-related matrix-associated actin-dependent regulator 1 of chromatin subfamily A